MRIAVVAVTTAIVAGALVTSLAVFWRATGTPTELDAWFAGWRDLTLIVVAASLLLLAFGSIRLVRGVLGPSTRRRRDR